MAVTHPPRALQVRLLPDALRCAAASRFTARSSVGPGRHSLTVGRRVRIPSGLLPSDAVRQRVRQTTQAWRAPAGSHKAGLPGSTPGPGNRGWAGAQPSLISWDRCGSTPIPAMPAGIAPQLVWRVHTILRPVVQRQRLLSYKEETGVRFPPGRLGKVWRVAMPVRWE